MNWWPALLGWPAVMLSLIMAALGIVHNRPWFFAVSVLLSAPVGLYMSGTPRFAWLSVAALVLFVFSGLAVRWRKTALAWLLLLPVIVMAVWLAYLVMSPGP